MFCDYLFSMREIPDLFGCRKKDYQTPRLETVMPPFEVVKVNDEAELESIVMEHMDTLEPGLLLLDHQRRTETARLDVMCADSEASLVIVELKMKEEDGMLLQALGNLDYVNENKDRFAAFYNKKLKHENKQLEVDKGVPPRIILVAPSFSDSMRKAVKYVDENHSVSLKRFES